MAVLGLLLVLAATVTGAELIAGNTNSIDVELFGRTFSDLPVGGVFLAGAIGMLLLLLGLSMLGTGLGRSRRRRAARTAEIRQQKQAAASLQDALAETADENDRLRRELAEERLAQDTLGGVAVPPQADGRVSMGTEPARAAAREQSFGIMRGRHRARG